VRGIGGGAAACCILCSSWEGCGKAQQGSEVMATTGIEGLGDQRARAGVWKGFPLSMVLLEGSDGAQQGQQSGSRLRSHNDPRCFGGRGGRNHNAETSEITTLSRIWIEADTRLSVHPIKQVYNDRRGSRLIRASTTLAVGVGRSSALSKPAVFFVLPLPLPTAHRDAA
jgi:hypothetical protein